MLGDVILFDFAWPRVAELLGAQVAPRRVQTFPGVVLTWPARQALLCDNAGEFNACALDRRQIDYQAKPSAETLAGLVELAERVDDPREPASCFCTMRHGRPVGVSCIVCQLGRGPLEMTPPPVVRPRRR